MGLRTDIQVALAIAFAGDLADAVHTFNFTSIDNEPTYDPSTGLTSTPTTLSGLNGAFVDFTVKELTALNSVLTEEEKVRPTDVKLIALQTVLTVEPKKGDTVAVSDGRTYRVIGWNQDPAWATYEVQLRTMSDE